MDQSSGGSECGCDSQTIQVPVNRIQSEVCLCIAVYLVSAPIFAIGQKADIRRESAIQ